MHKRFGYYNQSIEVSVQDELFAIKTLSQVQVAEKTDVLCAASNIF